MGTRADLIYNIVSKNGGKLSVSDIRKKVAESEGVQTQELNPSIVPATVRQDNKINADLGKTKRFNTEQRGYISIYDMKIFSSKKDIIENPETGIPKLIEEVNIKTRHKIREALQQIDWREFETNFLPSILESLGFHNIQVTQPTRDGGLDALCNYQRGLVKSEAIVSAKHWHPKQSVSVQEVQRLRGLRGNSDTGIIITTAKFTQDAINEAAPSQNQRSIVLIDGETIVDICLEKNFGVSEIETPKLYNFVGFQDTDNGTNADPNDR